MYMTPTQDEEHTVKQKGDLEESLMTVKAPIALEPFNLSSFEQPVRSRSRSMSSSSSRATLKTPKVISTMELGAEEEQEEKDLEEV